MNAQGNKVNFFLNELFPGRDGIPDFISAVKSDIFTSQIENYTKIENLCNETYELYPNLNINEKIKLMRKDNFVVVNSFIEKAIEFYFSSPQVIEALTGSPVPLFPNERFLSDIDYDLLEPVYLRMIEN